MSVPFSGIPFPQSGDKSPPLPSIQASGSSMQGRLVMASPQMASTGLYSSDRSSVQQDNKPLRQLHSSNASSSSSSSGQGENLPSIRNLLLSIGHDSPQNSASSMRRSPSAPDRSYYPTVAIDHHHHPPPQSRTPPVGATKREPRIAPNTLAQPYPWEKNDTSPRVGQWDLQGPIRSMSPQRRPPIAMSAFAHSQYMQQQQQQLHAAHSGGPMNQPRNVAVFSRGGRHESKKARPRHSPSSSIPSIASEDLTDANIHPSLGLWTRGEAPHAGMVPMSHLQKRQSPPTEEQERELAERSPAATRRRHTVGALEEPIHLRDAAPGLQQAMRGEHKGAVELTPKRDEPLVRAATMRNLDSPATPTAGGMVRHEIHHHPVRDVSSGGVQYAGPLPPPPSIHRVYMQQHADAGNNSMPSLTSSVSSTSLVSEHLRKHSLEEAGDRRMTHGGWLPHMSPQGSATGYPNVKPSGAVTEAMSSPRSSVWHSRSSTLDSVITTSSVASSQVRPYARPLPPPRSSSLRFEEESSASSSLAQPVTPTGRSREPSGSTHRDDSLERRRRHESMRDGMHPVRPFHPFVSQDSLLGQESNSHMRQRAQTMTNQDRRIAPLPSYSQTSLQHYSASNASSPYSGRPGRSNSSLSVSSVASLPQRVSSMEIDTEQGRARRYHEHAARSPPSSSMALSHSHSQSTVGPLPVLGQSPFSSHAASVGSGNVVITSSGGGASSGSKYECGWCGKRFSRPSSLKIHHHSHTGEKPFACPAPGCGRTFSVQSNLRRHQKCHSAAIANASKAAASQLDSSSAAARAAKEGGQSGAFGLPAARYSVTDAPHHPKESSAVASGLTRVSNTSNRSTSQQQGAGRVDQASPFGRSRDRRPSLGSSNAEDDADREEDDEDDDVDLGEDEEGEMDDDDSTMRGRETELLDGHRHVDEGMQDIQEESEAPPPERRQSHLPGQVASQGMSNFTGGT